VHTSAYDVGVISQISRLEGRRSTFCALSSCVATGVLDVSMRKYDGHPWRL
jgi:hypothetical protein